MYTEYPSELVWGAFEIVDSRYANASPILALAFALNQRLTANGP